MRWLIFLLLPFGAQAQIDCDTIELAKNLNVPWSMQWVGEGAIYFTEREGTIKSLNIENGAINLLYTVPDVAVEIQSGLLGLALHPDFYDTFYFYATCTRYTNDYSIYMQVLRFRLNQLEGKLDSMTVIVDSIPSGNTNIGGRLLTVGNYMYVTVGDGGTGLPAADTTSLRGKILRYHLDGTIPNDNPFPDSPVWSMGHRNPQGLVLFQGGIVSTEHGALNNDELNSILKGVNYGWPGVVGRQRKPNHATPEMVWESAVAPSGIAAKGDTLLIACLKGQKLEFVRKEKDAFHHQKDVYSVMENAPVLPSMGRIRDVLVNPDGRVFICTSNRDMMGKPTENDDKIIELLLDD